MSIESKKRSRSPSFFWQNNNSEYTLGMETTNSSEHIPYVCNYQRNKITVNQALAEDLSIDWDKMNYNKKTKLIYWENIKDVVNIKNIEETKNDSRINKAIIIEWRKKTLKSYKKKEIPQILIDANEKEINDILSSKKITNKKLYWAAKILRWYRYNFNWIVLEESETNIKEGKIKTLTRHLEWWKIDKLSMAKSLIDWINFYETHFNEEFMNQVHFIKSWSRLRNEEFLKFEAKIRGEDNMINIDRQNTLQRTKEELWWKFIWKDEETADNNDKFLYITKFWDSGEIIKEKITPEQIEEIEKFLKDTIGITKDNKNNISPKKFKKAKEKRSKLNKNYTRNATIIARVLYWPIPDYSYLIPIEKIKKINIEELEKEIENQKKTLTISNNKQLS